MLSLDKIFKNEGSFFQRKLADLAAFNFEVQHKSGKSSEMRMADFLSRYSYERSSKDAETQTGESAQIFSQHEVQKVITLANSDKTIKPITLDDIKRDYPIEASITPYLKLCGG